MTDKIAEIRITLALNPKQIAERILSGEVTSDSHFVSQEGHLHVASLLDAAHREIAKLRAEIDGLEAELALMNSDLEAALRWYADQRNHFPVELRSPGDPDPAVVFVDEPAIMTDCGRRAREALEDKP